MENKILSEISNTCENCRSRECCLEKECVLFRIEQIVLKQRKKTKENNRLKEVIDKAQEFIRDENYLNESEIDELSEILDSYRYGDDD